MFTMLPGPRSYCKYQSFHYGIHFCGRLDELDKERWSTGWSGQCVSMQISLHSWRLQHLADKSLLDCLGANWYRLLDFTTISPENLLVNTVHNHAHMKITCSTHDVNGSAKCVGTFFISDPAILLRNKSNLLHFSACYVCTVCTNEHRYIIIFFVSH